MEVSLMHLIAAAAVTGAASSMGTVLVLRTDMRWMKKGFSELKGRVVRLESAVFLAKEVK